MIPAKFRAGESPTVTRAFSSSHTGAADDDVKTRAAPTSSDSVPVTAPCDSAGRNDVSAAAVLPAPGSATSCTWSAVSA